MSEYLSPLTCSSCSLLRAALAFQVLLTPTRTIIISITSCSNVFIPRANLYVPCSFIASMTTIASPSSQSKCCSPRSSSRRRRPRFARRDGNPLELRWRPSRSRCRQAIDPWNPKPERVARRPGISQKSAPEHVITRCICDLLNGQGMMRIQDSTRSQGNHVLRA